MAWANSRVFRSYEADKIANIAAFDFPDDAVMAALFNGTITPDNDVTAADSAYDAGQWDSANEVAEAGQWPAGGVALAGKVVSVAVADQVKVDADNTASGSAADLANVHGVLVYDGSLVTPVANQGLSYHYLGGANSVVNGTFTVVWDPTNGLHLYTLS